MFEKDLKKRKVALEGMLRNVLTAALRMAEEIAGQSGFYTNEMRITVDQHVYPGPRSPDLVRLDIEAVDAGIMDIETAMSRMGIEDTEAEKARISRSVDNLIKIFEGLATSASVFEAEGMPDLLKQLGVPEEIVDTLVPKETPDPMEQPNAFGQEADPATPNIAEEQ